MIGLKAMNELFFLFLQNKLIKLSTVLQIYKYDDGKSALIK